VKNLLDIDDHYLHFPKDQWGWTDLNNPDMVNPWIEIQEIVNPKKVIEIGMFAGHSSLLMMTVFKNLQSLVSYDPHDVSEINSRQIKKYWPQHSYYKEAIWGNEGRHSDIDLIFVDGSHTFPAPSNDLDSCMKIKPRYIVVDNLEIQDVRWAVKIDHNLFSLKYEPMYWFYSNIKYSTMKKCELKSPGVMGLFKMEGNYESS